VRGQGDVRCFVLCTLVSGFFLIWFSCSFRVTRSGLCLFSFVLAAIVFLIV